MRQQETCWNLQCCFRLLPRAQLTSLQGTRPQKYSYPLPCCSGLESFLNLSKKWWIVQFVKHVSPTVGDIHHLKSMTFFFGYVRFLKWWTKTSLVDTSWWFRGCWPCLPSMHHVSPIVVAWRWEGFQRKKIDLIFSWRCWGNSDESDEYIHIYSMNTRWWFQVILIFTPTWGNKWSNLTNMFQMGWCNHQLEYIQ